MRLFSRRVSLLGAKERLARFGSYRLVLPSEQALAGPPVQRDFPGSAIPCPPYINGKIEPLLKAPLNATEDISGIADACLLARRVLTALIAECTPGKTTSHLDSLAFKLTTSAGAYPSPLGYMGFPRSICTSINNVACHGIPNDRELVDGDIVNIDVTVYLDGFHGDTSQTVCVGSGVDEKGALLVQTTREALMRAVEVCKPGVGFKEIGNAVQTLADRKGYAVSPHFCGHGIGRGFHQPPIINHARNNEMGCMEQGMIFTIEPILCQGSAEYVLWPDNWTAVTKDGGRSAQFGIDILRRTHYSD